MKAKIISQSKLSDTYEEWYKDYVKNVIEPFNRTIRGMYHTEKTREFVCDQTVFFMETVEKMKQHYGIDQPKIEHVEVSFSIQL